jgi:hypothetical protein
MTGIGMLMTRASNESSEEYSDTEYRDTAGDAAKAVLNIDLVPHGAADVELVQSLGPSDDWKAAREQVLVLK